MEMQQRIRSSGYLHGRKQLTGETHLRRKMRFADGHDLTVSSDNAVSSAFPYEAEGASGGEDEDEAAIVVKSSPGLRVNSNTQKEKENGKSGLEFEDLETADIVSAHLREHLVSGSGSSSSGSGSSGTSGLGLRGALVEQKHRLKRAYDNLQGLHKHNSDMLKRVERKKEKVDGPKDLLNNEVRKVLERIHGLFDIVGKQAKDFASPSASPSSESGSASTFGSLPVKRVQLFQLLDEGYFAKHVAPALESAAKVSGEAWLDMGLGGKSGQTDEEAGQGQEDGQSQGVGSPARSFQRR